MTGKHCLKTWSETQATVAKSSAESELYGGIKASSEGLGRCTLMADLGTRVKVCVNVDGSAAIGIVERRNFSQIRHFDVDVLWLQEMQARRMLPLQEINGKFKPADLMTKQLPASVLPDVEWNTGGVAHGRQHTYTFARMVIRGDVRVRTVNGFGPKIHEESIVHTSESSRSSMRCRFCMHSRDCWDVRRWKSI